MRQWRALIEYRAKLVGRRTAVKNSIRALLDRQGLSHTAGRAGWSQAAVEELQRQARPLEDVAPEELWRGQLAMELVALEQAEALIRKVEMKLNALALTDERVQRLQTIDGVGPRLAETVVAVLDDPKRFKNRKQVGAYVGLVPRQYESGQMHRSGGITGAGHRLLRTLLVEVGWMALRFNSHLRAVFDRVCRQHAARRKIAVVAVARRLLIICWAMLRDGTAWRPPRAVPTP